MTADVERLDRPAHTGEPRHTVVYENELVRHGVYTRTVHWAVAILFVLALLSGFAVYSPWLYRWITPLFGGGALTRLLHPWFGVAFFAVFILEFVNWLAPMAWRRRDNEWMRHLRAYVSNKEKLEPEWVGFFNAGQKVYFWAIVVTAIGFLVTGILMWFPEVFGRTAVWISYIIHDLCALIMLVGFIVHVYEGTGSQPGTFRSMTRGTVEKRWAWTLHPAWYRDATGRDPRDDYNAAAGKEKDVSGTRSSQ